jgi:hypothetical protein
MDGLTKERQVRKMLLSISDEDFFILKEFAPDRGVAPGDCLSNPVILAPNGTPYLYRWYVVPRNKVANVYLHIQVGSDPQDMHDHPWDNQSVILSGQYEERFHPGFRYLQHAERRILSAGDVVNRKAQMAHRLILPDGLPYAMSLFSTGPKVREWGYWKKDGWKPWKECVTEYNADGVSVAKCERCGKPPEARQHCDRWDCK